MRTTDDGLKKPLVWDQGDVVEYSPVTEKHVGTGLSLGDTTTDAKRIEPELNVPSGSDADTRTARALANDLRILTSGDALSQEDWDTLLTWMSGNATGDALIRAGAPAGWTVADKSGGAGGIRNDIAVMQRPDHSTIVLAILTQKNDPAADFDNALVARTAEAALKALG